MKIFQNILLKFCRHEFKYEDLHFSGIASAEKPTNNEYDAGLIIISELMIVSLKE